jgi:hypothetical protein
MTDAIFGAFCALALCGATTVETGGDHGYWSNHSVVYGIAEQITSATKGEYVMTFIPMATLAGTFDPAEHENVRASFRVSQYGGALNDPPANGTAVIIVLHKKDDHWLIPTNVISYLPDRRAIVPVEGFDDPVVESAVARLKEMKRRWTGFQIDLDIEMKPLAADRGVERADIERRIFEVLPNLFDFSESDVNRIIFKDGSDLTVGDLAEIRIKLRPPAGKRWSGKGFLKE